MPPLICAPTAILDQSFPRNRTELQRISLAVGNIQGQLDRNEIHLILSDQLIKCLDKFDWNVRDGYELLQQIYIHISQWYLSGNSRTERISLSDVKVYCPHPLPKGCIGTGLLESWSQEVGKMLAKHDKCCRRSHFFIGVACESAYSGSDKGSYDNPMGIRTFPLVGPDEIVILDDAYEWDVPPDIIRRSIFQEHVKSNYQAIGATKIQPPSRDSHYKVIFSGKRSWTFTANIDPVPPRFLDELVRITGYPLPAIKYALIEGHLPNIRLCLR